MKRLLWVLLFLALLAPPAYSKNLYKGFEKSEFSVGIEERCDFDSETNFSFGYALSNRYEFVLGYITGRDYHKSKVINMDINLHFFPKRRFDLYFGIGPSLCSEDYRLYDYFEIAADYLGGSSILGLNIFPSKYISLGAEIKVRMLKGISEYGNDAIYRGRLFLGLKCII